MAVIHDVCLKAGHRIQALQKEGAAVVDPVSKQMVPVFEHVCIACGRSREACLNYREGGPSRARRKNARSSSSETKVSNSEIGSESTGSPGVGVRAEGMPLPPSAD